MAARIARSTSPWLGRADPPSAHVGRHEREVGVAIVVSDLPGGSEDDRLVGFSQLHARPPGHCADTVRHPATKAKEINAVFGNVV